MKQSTSANSKFTNVLPPGQSEKWVDCSDGHRLRITPLSVPENEQALNSVEATNGYLTKLISNLLLVHSLVQLCSPIGEFIQPRVFECFPTIHPDEERLEVLMKAMSPSVGCTVNEDMERILGRFPVTPTAENVQNTTKYLLPALSAQTIFNWFSNDFALVKKRGNARSLEHLLKIMRGFIFFLQSGICFDDERLTLSLVANDTDNQLFGCVRAARSLVLENGARKHDHVLFRMVKRLVMFHLSYASYDYFCDDEMVPSTFWWLKILPKSMPAFVEPVRVNPECPTADVDRCFCAHTRLMQFLGSDSTARNLFITDAEFSYVRRMQVCMENMLTVLEYIGKLVQDDEQVNSLWKNPLSLTPNPQNKWHPRRTFLRA